MIDIDIKKVNLAKQFNDVRFTKIDLFKNKHSVNFLLNFLPGQEMKAHHHPGKELYLHVLEGKGYYLIDGIEVPVQAGDVIHCHAEQKLGFVNNSDSNVSIFTTMTKIRK